jgi:hypothetical protein
MKNPLLIFPVIILLLSACVNEETETRWEIKKENPVYGLTLRYLLPSDQIQKIVGNKVLPLINDEGMGYLNLTVMTTNQYYIDGQSYDNMKQAHILAPTQNSVTVALTMGAYGQKLNDVFWENNFNRIIGDIDLTVEEENDSLSIKAQLITTTGNITMSAKALNIPGELNSIDSVKVTSAESPNNYFIGSESSRRIQIDSISISESGENWISSLHLPAKPSQIVLSIYYAWDFMFTEESLPDSNAK